MEIDNDTVIANILSNDIYTSSIPKNSSRWAYHNAFHQTPTRNVLCHLGVFLSPTFTRLGGTSVSHLNLDGWDALSSQKTLCWKASKSKLFRTSGSQVPWRKRTFLACKQSYCYGWKQTKTYKNNKSFQIVVDSAVGWQAKSEYIVLAKILKLLIFPQKKLNSGKLIQLYHDSHDRSCLDTQSSQGQLCMMLFLWGHLNHSQALEKTNKTKQTTKKQTNQTNKRKTAYKTLEVKTPKRLGNNIHLPNLNSSNSCAW